MTLRELNQQSTVPSDCRDMSRAKCRFNRSILSIKDATDSNGEKICIAGMRWKVFGA